MAGSRNDGGATLFFFALDSTGQLWRGTATDLDQPVWSRFLGPLSPPAPDAEPTFRGGENRHGFRGSLSQGSADASSFPAQDPIEAFRHELASLRERVGTAPRGPVEENLQRLGNRRFHLLIEFASEKKRIDDIVAEHQALAPQLTLPLLASG
jgi:hypothetical protein